MQETENDKEEFWESNFKKKKELWGLKPSNSALQVMEFFIQKNVKNLLIPGIGYGRNAQIFIKHGIEVTGIEISKTAIELAKIHIGTNVDVYHGSVTEMPFDSKKYNGIFCHGLIHLLEKNQREKLILDCYEQLAENGYMIFTTITKQAPNFGKGKRLGTDRYEFHKGVKLFYYDPASIQDEFGKAGLFEITEISENQPFYLIKCKK